MDFNYIVEEDGIRIMKYTGNDKSVEIPESIDGHIVKVISVC